MPAASMGQVFPSVLSASIRQSLLPGPAVFGQGDSTIVVGCHPTVAKKKRGSHPKMTAPFAYSNVMATSDRAWLHDRHNRRRHRFDPVHHRFVALEDALR